MKKAIDILSGRTKKLIMMHQSADPDALGSAYALSRVFGGDIDMSGGLNRLAKRMRDHMGIEGIYTPDYGDYDVIIVVDTASPKQLVKIPQKISLVIDHHMQSGEWDGCGNLLIDERALSCALIVKRMIEEAGKPLDKDTALALILGIYTDTNSLSLGDSSLFSGLSELLRIAGTDIPSVMEILDDRNMSAKIAVMKGLQRLKFDTFMGFVLAGTYVGGFEGAVANALRDAGADIAFAASERGGKVRVSGRASSTVTTAGFHLGRMFAELGYEIEGDGGGHGGAARFETEGDVEAVLKICMTKAKDILRSGRPERS